MAYVGETSPLYTANETYVAELYQKFLNDPASIDRQWAEFFSGLDDADLDFLNGYRGPSWGQRGTTVIGGDADSAGALSDTLIAETERGSPYEDVLRRLAQGAAPHASASEIRQATLDSIRALMIIRAYRMRGHSLAHLDPLNLHEPSYQPELDPKTYGFEEKDMDRPIFINYYLGLESASMREIVRICQETYCGSIGVEFQHIQVPEEKSWIQERIEGIRNRTEFTDLGKKTILERLTQADVFETYLDKKYRGTKRFGLDGGETLVPVIEQIFKRGAQLGLQEVVIGMAHRGRLNVLANIMRKPYQAIFAEFEGISTSPEDVQGSGDVKYHLGTSADREFDGRVVHLSLTANPSHLEAVNTVVLGKVRAKQRQRGDADREAVMGLLLHGDAAFIGQGIVAETFLLSELDGYKTGGTIHIAINNQIGFTTAPSKSRSSPYCSDMAKIVDAPVFHVNGDDPEACVHVARIAIEYRQKFKKDVVVDMWCYRRHGHNEGDEPMFTQPSMYTRIDDQPRTRQLYAQKLESGGIIPEGTGAKIVEEFTNHLDKQFEARHSYKANKADWLEGKWAGLSIAEGDARRGQTGVDIDLLKEVGYAISEVPQNFNLNSKIARQLNQKRKMIESGKDIDWGTAEALAFGTLLCESTSIRLSGEDSERGTFSQRHSVLTDQKTEDKYVPLNNIRMGQAPFEVIDSPLSEFGLLGYEYGYASAEPHSLVLWEAQFGDFANGAQVIIDQFIASAESKWLRMCGLVMLLPHGYEGQGPEHSSARLERYLQLSAEDNWQVCNITSPSNYFHALRRQVRRNFRKPLILMTPKSLLRHKRCISTLDEMAEGSTFHRLLWDDGQFENRLVKDSAIKRVVVCSGKVYFDLLEERNARGIDDVYLLRVEQLFPWPEAALEAELSRFPNAEVLWCQEEPENAGAWFFVDRRLEKVLITVGNKVSTRPRFVGRPAAASPAAGRMKDHVAQLKAFVNEALTVDRPATRKAPVKKAAAKRAAAKKASAKKATARKAGAKK